ncbi:MAG: hypothetical protein K1V81_01855 [Paramuribaculum sp.]|jgi:hypothetical protein
MKKTIVLLILGLAATATSAQSVSEQDVLRTTADKVAVILDGKPLNGGWSVLYGTEVDPLETKAAEIVFASDIDTLKIELGVWESRDFSILSADGRKGPVKVISTARFPM